MANLPYQPTWKKHEKAAHNPHDADAALKASDAFEKEREQELKTSQKARDWEFDRKKEIASQKPQWKKQQLKAEQDKKTKPLKSLKDLGSFDHSITPYPGYLIIELDEVETTTESGIILQTERTEPNTGTVVAVSDPLIVVTEESVHQIPCPVKIGDRILFKRYAGAMGSPGAELSIKGQDYRLMRWNPDPKESDILGTFTEVTE